MADVQKANVTAPIPAPTASTNGPAPAKRVTKPREVPVIAVGATKEEHQEIQDALVKALGGLKMNVPLGGFVLAHALKSIRSLNTAAK